jgi:hypothetical protein
MTVIDSHDAAYGRFLAMTSERAIVVGLALGLALVGCG